MLKGYIKKIDIDKITFVCAEDWDFNPYEQPIPMGNVTTLRLPIKRELIDKAVSLCTKYVALEVKNGKIAKIEQLEKPKPEYNMLDTRQKALSLRDKFQIVLKKITEMEEEMGFADEQKLLEDLEATHNLRKEEVKRLIGVFIRDGTIYYCGEGKIKKKVIE